MRYLIPIVIFLMACSTTPTGRSQLKLLSSSKMANLGRESYQEIKKQKPLVKDAKIKDYVDCVTNHILKAMGENPQAWEIQVFKDPSPNAFALPGKKMGIHSGMLDVAQNQSQLAAVIGHEIAHVKADHGNERVSQTLILQSGLAIADIALNGEENGKKNQTILAALGLGAQFGVMLPFSRKHESEADELGLTYMAKAGFRPQGAVELWQNMAKKGSSPPEFLSTHPAPKTRIQDLQALVPKVYPTYQGIKQKPNCR